MHKKGNILLINPSYATLFEKIKGSEWKVPPLGISYIAAVMERDGHRVAIIDWDMHKYTYDESCKNIKEEHFDVIGITATTPVIENAYFIAETVKNISPATLVVLGGPHPSALPLEVAGNKSVDVVVAGEGEETFRELVNRFLCDGSNIKDIAGTVLKDNGMVRRNKERALIDDMDSLPFPARHLLKMENYFISHPLSRTDRTASLLTSRGCPYTCGYCNKSVFGTKYRMHSVEYVVAEIEKLVKDYSIKEFHVVDDTFSLDRARAIKICEELIRKKMGLKWATPNGINIATFNEELARAMKKSGCYSVSFGIESGNQKTLDYINKNLRLEEVEKAFKVAKKAGLETVAFIIIGLPNETRKDIRETLKFLMKIKPDVADFHTLIPLPGTRIYNELKRKDYILEHDYSKYTFHNRPVYRTDWLDRDQIGEAYEEAYRQYHLRPRYIMRRITRIRSMRDVVINIKGMKTIIKNFVLKKK